jgi:hypothetical protein
MSKYDDLVFAPVSVVHIDGRQEGLFRAHKGRRLIAANRKQGTTPFVGASRVNNSVTDFADTPALFPGGWVTLIYNGDGGAGYAKYQPVPFCASDDVIALEPLSTKALEPALLLIASMLTHQCVPKFGHGYKLTLDRLERQKIMAPVTTSSDGKQVVDWVGMTRLGTELLCAARKRMTLVRTSASTNDVKLPSLSFKPILITDLFALHNGSGAPKKAIGTHPYVAASFQNNGVVGYVDAAKYPGGWLSLVKDGDGGAGKCFYQPAPFWPSNHVLALEPKASGLNADALICMAALITHQCFPKYHRGYAVNASRLSRQKIMVPIIPGANGEQVVDWDGITRYGHALRVWAERRMEAVLDAVK